MLFVVYHGDSDYFYLRVDTVSAGANQEDMDDERCTEYDPDRCDFKT